MKLKENEFCQSKFCQWIQTTAKTIKALCVPKICSSIKGHNLSCVVKNHDFIPNLPLANTSFDIEANIDIFIGAHLYYRFVTGEMKRSENCYLVAYVCVSEGKKCSFF